MNSGFEGVQLGMYRLKSLIGRGGMGNVYLAHHQRLDRVCAVKILRPELSADREFRARFLREARAAARLNHPNIVTIYDAGEQDDVAYFAMQYVEGTLLSSLISSAALTTEQTVELLHQVADALDTAHQAGIVHRDVKPTNVIVTDDGIAMLMDFGIVHLRPDAQLTATGQLVGTPAYMTPEQITGGSITPQTDIYQLGIVAYEMLTGVLPFHAAEPAALLVAHLQELPTPASDRVSSLPAAVSPVLNQALHKVPNERHHSAKNLVDAIGQALADNGTEVANERPGAALPHHDTTTVSRNKKARISNTTTRYGIGTSAILIAVIVGFIVFRAFPGNGRINDSPSSSAESSTDQTSSRGDDPMATKDSDTVESGAGDGPMTFGLNTDAAPPRTEEIVASYDVLELWPPAPEGVELFDVDGSPHLRFEDAEITLIRHTLGANFGNGSAFLEVSMLSNPETYVEQCLLARMNSAAATGYALCLSSNAETFAYYFDEETAETQQIEFLAPEVRLGTNQPSDWNDLEIRALDDQIWFLINDKLLGAITHQGPRSGEIGISAYRDGTEQLEIGWGVLAILEIGRPG